MPVTALVGYAVFFALAFGLRAVVHYRRTGMSGYVGFSADPFSVEWCAGVLFAAAVLGSGFAPVAELVGLVVPWTGSAAALGYRLGIAFTIVGIVGTLWSQLAMGASWRVGVDHGARTELVSRGPFRFVRNPIFTWMTFASAGLVLLTPNPIAIGSFVALLIALELQVRLVEEPYLMRTHGDAYRRYAAATGRFLPGIGRMS
jgi:protein-S-isoprenylcysteine O-methyltransferase Ste14